MTGQLLVMALAGVLLGLCGGYPWGRWNGNRALDRAEHRGWNGALEYCGVRPAGYGDEPERDPDDPGPPPEPEYRPGWTWTDEHGRVRREAYPGEHPGPPLVVGHTIYPELAALALQDSAALQLDEGSQRDVPEPGTEHEGPKYEQGLTSAGLGHTSPYTGPLTPAQRRRDKHKQRGPWAPGDLPDPPTDVGAWWQEELEALLRDGQSEWLTRNLAGAS